MKNRIAACLLAALAPTAGAHNPITTKLTWSRDISRIVYRRCAACHREGGEAPMSLLDYRLARPWAKAIQEEVLARRMPPWGAVKGFGDFQDDMGLTQEEIHLIADWVEGGAPEGDPAYLPDRPRAEDPLKPEPRWRMEVSASARLTRDVSLRAIAVKELAEGGSLRVVANLPGSRVEPLLWVYDFKAKRARPYVYRTPLRLPAGTRVEVVPPGAGRVVLSWGESGGAGQRPGAL